MRVGELLRLYRNIENIGIRDMAAELGVSHGTLSRVERGEDMSGATLSKILRWLTE
jgi:transcriptional regulator with XRE-family HTH domain